MYHKTSFHKFELIRRRIINKARYEQAAKQNKTIRSQYHLTRTSLENRGYIKINRTITHKHSHIYSIIKLPQNPCLSYLPCLHLIYVNEHEDYHQQPNKSKPNKTLQLFVHLMFHYPMTKKKSTIIFEYNFND